MPISVTTAMPTSFKVEILKAVHNFTASTGNTLSGATVQTTGTTVYVSFNNTSWANASFTCRGALIYNASKNDRSVAVLDFGNDKIVATQTFTVEFPPNAANSAIIRMN